MATISNSSWERRSAPGGAGIGRLDGGLPPASAGVIRHAGCAACVAPRDRFNDITGFGYERTIVSWAFVKSGGINYTVEQTSSRCTIRKNDAFIWSTGTRIGHYQNWVDALNIIKSHSGSNNVDLYWDGKPREGRGY